MWNSRLLRNKEGYSLIEMMVALAILAILGLSAGKLFELVFTNSQANQLANVRDNIIIEARKNASELVALRNALKKPENSSFYKCVCGGGCQTGLTYDFTMYDAPNADPTTDIPKSPQSYNAEGEPCNKADGNCFIEVTSAFVAQCKPVLPSANPIPPTTCNAPAEFVQVTYTVQQVNTVQYDHNILRTIRSGAFTNVKDINPDGSGVCP